MDIENLSAYQQPSPAPAPLIPKKSKLPLILGMALLALAVGATGYFVATKKYGIAQESPTPSISATPDVTAGWKTYTNTEYGFKYPSGVVYSDSGSGPSSPKNQLSVTLSGLEHTTPSKYPHTISFSVLAYPAEEYTKNPVDPNVEKLVYIDNNLATTLGWGYSRRNLDGEVWWGDVSYEITKGLFHYSIRGVLKGNEVTFEAEEFNSDPGIQESKLLINRILSTFKFTK